MNLPLWLEANALLDEASYLIKALNAGGDCNDDVTQKDVDLWLQRLSTLRQESIDWDSKNE